MKKIIVLLCLFLSTLSFSFDEKEINFLSLSYKAIALENKKLPVIEEIPFQIKDKKLKDAYSVLYSATYHFNSREKAYNFFVSVNVISNFFITDYLNKDFSDISKFITFSHMPEIQNNLLEKAIYLIDNNKQLQVFFTKNPNNKNEYLVFISFSKDKP